MDDAESARHLEAEAVPPLLVHTRVQRYELLVEIGRGGMGIVYRARDTSLGRLVALKRPWPKVAADPAQRRRFLREARAAARISHPHVVPVFEVLEDDGIPWIAMELVGGASLRGLLGAGALPLAEVLRHGEGLADALAAAHASGVLHGDVTPNNILVDGSGRVLLTDFGLAQFVGGPVDADASTVSGRIDLSREAGRIAGTPGYMSPEQARGRGVDARSDLFSLGAVLYEMCTGHRAFVGENGADLAEAVLVQAPPDIPPSTGLPDALRRAVHKSLAKDPDERYQTARDLLADLRVLRRDIEYEQHVALRPARQATRQGRPYATAALAAALVVGVTAVAGYHFYPRAAARSQFSGPVSLLIADFENTTGDAVFNETLVESLNVALSQSRHLNVFPRERVVGVLRRMRRPPDTRIAGETGREICRREGLKILLDGSIRRSGTVYQIQARAIEPVSGDILFAETDQFEARNELFRRVDRLAHRVRENLGESTSRIEQSDQPLEKATTESLPALQFYSQAKRVEALGDQPGAVDLLRAALQVDPGFAMAHAHLGGILGAQGDVASAKAHLESAYLLRSDLTALERLHVEADYYDIQGEYDKGLASLRTLVDLYPADLSAHRKLASAYESAGDLPAAVRELRACLLLDPLNARVYSALALVYIKMNLPSEAVSALAEARSKGVSAPDFHWPAGLAWWSLDDVERARAEFQALEGAGSFYAGLGGLNLARLAVYEGKLSEAEERLTDGIRRDEREHNEVYRILRRNLRARVRWLSGNVRGAREDLESVTNLTDPTFAPYQLLWAARLWIEMGEPDQARGVVTALRRLTDSRPVLFNRACLRVADGEIALAERHPGRAVDQFLAADAERPIYEVAVGLARAYAAQRDWKRSAEAWSRVLSSKGAIIRTGNPADIAIAHFELGRAYQALADPAQSGRHYEAARRLWQHADAFPLQRALTQETGGRSE